MIGAAACIAVAAAGDPRRASRERMVDGQIAARGIADARVLAAMRKVPRHEFVPPAVADQAYDDQALPIGQGQTISQPYVVALMTEAAAIRPGAKVLEVGTGSGYQAAILAEVAKDVYTIEIVESLAKSAETTLRRLGYERVHVRQGDGYRGWPEAAPFDAIIVTAAPETVPPPLLNQLAPGGRLVIPVGNDVQQLEVHRRTPTGIEIERIAAVRFVPMTGEARGKRRRLNRRSPGTQTSRSRDRPATRSGTPRAGS